MGVGFSACRHGGRMPEAGKRSLKASLTSAVTKLLARRPDLVLVKVARKSVFKKELKYFRRNRRRMRYAALGARNLPIGSGVVEATCKSLVSVRMKRGGMRWGQPGGQAVLTLRALRQSGIGNRESGQFDAAWDALYRDRVGEVVTLRESVVDQHLRVAA